MNYELLRKQIEKLQSPEYLEDEDYSIEDHSQRNRACLNTIIEGLSDMEDGDVQVW